SIRLNTTTGNGAGTFTSTLGNNNVTGILIRRFTDTGPTGDFEVFATAANVAVWDVDIGGVLNAGVIPVARINGILSVANGGTGVDIANPNLVFAGPNGGALAQPPSFRALTALDIPSLSYVPLSRSLTINGETNDLSSDRTWTLKHSFGFTTDGAGT